MLSALSGAQSGLNDARVRLDVAAHNVANLNTPGFEPAQVVSVEAPGGGVTSIVTQAEPADVPDRMSAADLVTQVVATIMARIAFSANASALRVAAANERRLFEVLT